MVSNCQKCIFRDTYRDMGASMDVCTLIKDLSRSNAEIKFYSLCHTCSCYLSIEDLREFVLNNDERDVRDVFNYISLNKE